MADKKGKALVMKLFDDLLSPEDGSSDDQQEKSKTTPLVTDESTAAPRTQASAAMPVDSESSRTIPTSDITAPGGSSVASAQIRAPATSNPSAGSASAQVRSSVGRSAPLRSVGFSSGTEAALATSENLRIAQNRLLELEQEISRLRTDNEQLAAAGETLRRRADELLTQNNHLQNKLAQTIDVKDQEIEILRQAQREKDKEIATLRMKTEEMEMRLSTNIQKIRVRERELENRLELVKMEGAALVRSKDELILDLKRQTDQLNLELENYRNKGQELNRQLTDRQETLRRTVKALRLALSMLEGDEDAVAAKKVK